MIDNFDSFTYNLVDYFHQLGQEVEIIRNDVHPEQIDFTKYSGIVLSPGPGVPAKANHLLDYLESIPKSIPVLGICLGHQAIGEYFGARLIKASAPMHGKLSEVNHNDDELFKDVPDSFEVVRYHSLILDELPSELASICTGPKQEIMAMKHRAFPIYGIQFHPESVLTQYGMKLLENWLLLNNIQTA